jgi:hypothetical protein
MSLREAAEAIERDASNSLLVELNEPEAWLEALRRIADKRAKQLDQGFFADEMAAKRWQKLVKSIETVQSDLEKPQSQTPKPDC